MIDSIIHFLFTLRMRMRMRMEYELGLRWNIDYLSVFCSYSPILGRNSAFSIAEIWFCIFIFKLDLAYLLSCDQCIAFSVLYLRVCEIEFHSENENFPGRCFLIK